MVIRWAAAVTDVYFAPEFSKFTEATIPDMTAVDAEQEHWLSNYLLNTAVRGRLETPQRQQIYNFLRKTHSAFASYAAAREATSEFLLDRNRIRRYISAVGHWEDFLAHAWHAYSFLVNNEPVLFEPHDGSELQRLHALHTRAKHAAAAIARGDFIEESPLCVWLTNGGMRSTESVLTYEEAADVLRHMAGIASAVQDPLTVGEKLPGALAGAASAGSNATTQPG